MKELLKRVLAAAGYTAMRTATYETVIGRLDAAESALAARLGRANPAGTDLDYQAESQNYHLRTGTGDMDPAFLPLFEACRAFTMTSADRMFALYKAVEYVERMRIPGAFVECGVWRGGSMMLAAKTLLALGVTRRELYLFDTFEGLPRPDEAKDVDVWGNRAIDGWRPHARDDRSSSWALATLNEVKANFASIPYPGERIHFVKGMVEETIPAGAPERIALLRLDTDWYASTKHELEHLFPRLARDGVLIIDDYGHFKGARQAVDEYLAKHGLPMMLIRVDYTGRIAIKNFD